MVDAEDDRADRGVGLDDGGLSVALDFGPNVDLAAALADCERYRSSSRAARLLRKPIPATIIALYRLLPWLPTLRVRARLFSGQTLGAILPEYLSRETYLHGFFEAPLTRILLSQLRPGMVFADVGAQFGYYSVLAEGLVGPTGRVFAFEPTPTTYSILRENVSGFRNVVAENLAVYSSAGVLTLHDFGGAHAGLNSVLPHPRVAREEAERLQGRRFEARSVRLDDYFGERGIKPDFVKIDVESAEIYVLRGMEDLLANVRPAVSVETGDYGWTGAGATRECIRFLLERGYQCFEYGAGRLMPHRQKSSYGYDNLLFLPDRGLR
jgi:FkbM family methyltransferase